MKDLAVTRSKTISIFCSDENYIEKGKFIRK